MADRQHSAAESKAENGTEREHWARRMERTARRFALATLAIGILVVAAIAWQARPSGGWAFVAIPFGAAAGAYWLLTRKVRRRRAILAQPFPVEWEAVLQREVVFFRALEPAEKQRFRREIQLFLGEKRVTGIGMQVDATTRVLTAASAIIPIFGFPEWEWNQINEVLIYPSRFNQDFSFEEGAGRHTLGMVGTGPMNGLMILVKPDLLHGFRNAADKHNVGIHEFAHLVDKSDGAIDGLPGVGLDRQAIGPWVDLMRRKMLEIEQGDSDIDPYALTNEAEFFAVTTEYFFERPGVMQRKHPELYTMLEKVFRQDLHARKGALAAERLRGRPEFGRNSPCPCGSGVKYKKCCLRKARRAA